MNKKLVLPKLDEFLDFTILILKVNHLVLKVISNIKSLIVKMDSWKYLWQFFISGQMTLVSSINTLFNQRPQRFLCI